MVGRLFYCHPMASLTKGDHCWSPNNNLDLGVFYYLTQLVKSRRQILGRRSSLTAATAAAGFV